MTFPFPPFFPPPAVAFFFLPFPCPNDAAAEAELLASGITADAD